VGEIKMYVSTYQAQAHKTAAYPPDSAVMYTALGLAGEAGEVANKVKKAIRDDGGIVTPARRAEILGELGDVLWYVAELCTALDANLAVVAQQNITKLRDRQQRGVIQGNGDKR